MTKIDFDSISQKDVHGELYWSARDLGPLLGYNKWQRFEDAINRAKKSCETNGNPVEHHFTGADKMVEVGSGAQRRIKDYFLSKYGCHLIAMNGDVRKPEIAAAQAYFLVSTKENEMHKLRLQQEERLKYREKVSEGNKSLFEAATLSGVRKSHLGVFEDSGILGQYTLTTAGLEDKRDIPSGELYNTMPPHELAGNLLRITQTDYNLRAKNIEDEDLANAEHYFNGQQVRVAMIAMSGEKPEDIPPAPSIKKLVEAQRRRAKKQLQNKPPDIQEKLF